MIVATERMQEYLERRERECRKGDMQRYRYERHLERRRFFEDGILKVVKFHGEAVLMHNGYAVVCLSGRSSAEKAAITFAVTRLLRVQVGENRGKK